MKTPLETVPLIDRKFLQILLGGVLFFALANICDQLLGNPFWVITRSIHLGYDDNIPAWYSSMLLLVAALVGLECYQVGNSRKISGTWTFLLFSGLLVLLSCDEITRFHENVGHVLTKSVGLDSSNLAKHSSWLILGAPIVLGIFGALYVLLRKLLVMVPGSHSALTSGFIFIIGGGVVLEGTINWLNHEELQWLWEAEIIVEETLEMFGTLCLAYALLIWRDELKNESTIG